ncbi:MAG: glutaredoxin 3 [Clostridia bacterium]|nr:glutaredoxin 3 [Clostridia bacterium]
MKQVKLYTTKFCPYCLRALKKLDQKGVEYTNINVSTNREAFDEIMKETGWDSVPQIFIDGVFIGGCDDLYALDDQGKLDELLGVG